MTLPGPHPNLAKAIAGVDTAHVLNPVLYERLVQKFGSVIIAKQGSAMFGGGYSYETGQPRYKPLDAGEYYRVCCPFCPQKKAVDTRHRLWINHRWGVGLDPEDANYDPNDKFWWMAHCYNEHCMEDPANRKELRNWIFGGIGRERHGEAIKIREGIKEPVALGVVDYPGQCQRIDELSPSHMAYQYILGRGMDPQVLGPKYDLSYCHFCQQWPAATNKLIIPIYMNRTMVGWQARPPFDADWKALGHGKYYNLPGINKRLMLYGYDQAKVASFCTVVEGVTDVWALGDGAVSLLGKDMSPQQAILITENWKAVILALDPDAADRAQRIYNMLNVGPLQGKVMQLRMPDGLDPASIDNDYFWDLVFTQASQMNLEL